MVFDVTKKSKTFFGFYMDDERALRFRLHCINEGSYLTQEMIDIINKYMDENAKTTKQLVKELAQKAHKEWVNLVLQNKDSKTWKNAKSLSKKWDYFVEKTKESLKKRGIDSETVDLIIHELLELEID